MNSSHRKQGLFSNNSNSLSQNFISNVNISSTNLLEGGALHQSRYSDISSGPYTNGETFTILLIFTVYWEVVVTSSISYSGKWWANLSKLQSISMIFHNGLSTRLIRFTTITYNEYSLVQSHVFINF